jgi:hypothetical protein
LTKSFRISRGSTVMQRGNLLSRARTQNDKFGGRYLRWTNASKEIERERRQALISLSHGDAFSDYKSRAEKLLHQCLFSQQAAGKHSHVAGNANAESTRERERARVLVLCTFR